MKAATLLVLLLPPLLACAPQRPPVPVGHIPQAEPLKVEEEQYGHTVLAALTEKYPLDYDHPRHSEVDDSVKRITKAAHADQDPWHVFVFKDAQFKNAAATRGNHVFIWTAMIDATRNQNELAAVLAHEIGHVLARHTDPDPNEELRKLLISLGAMAAGIAAAQATGSPTWGQTAGDLASSVTAQVGQGILVNPYSRDRELEADQIGLFLMADAKFDPRAAIDFWSRAKNDPSFGGSLEFFSTHPPTGDRLERLKAILPQALARYEGQSSQPPLFVAASALPIPGPMPWIVEAPRAILYTRPDAKSFALGEFVQGATVEVVGEEGEWLRVERPEIGYLERQALRKK